MQNVPEHENTIIGDSRLGFEEVMSFCDNATFLESDRNITLDVGPRKGNYLRQILNYEAAVG